MVVVNDYQLSLAIGKEGQNARLAARLTGWKIDIKSKTDFDNMSEEEIDQILGLNQEENTLEKTKEDIDLICVEDRSENQETIDNASGKLSDKKADDIENCTLEDAYNGKDLLSSQDDLKEIDLDGVYEAESDLILHGQEDKSEEDSEI